MARLTVCLHNHRDDPHWARLKSSAVVILPAAFVAVYALVFTAQFPLLRWHSTPAMSFAKLVGYSYLAAGGLALAGLALIMLGRTMWDTALTQPGRVTRIAILAGWTGASLALLFTYPGQSTDLGDYSFRGHMLVHLGRNPLTTPPSQVIPYKAYEYLAWYKIVDSYGPLWEYLAAGVHALTGETFLGNVLGFKAVAILCTGLSGGLVYAILRRLMPRQAVAGLALWLWNPVVLNEGALHGHNDLIVVVVTLAGLWLLLSRHERAGIVVLVAAGLVKATAWALLPVALVWVVRRVGWRRAFVVAAPPLLAGVALVWLAYQPFGGIGLLLDMARRRSWWPTGTWTAAAFYALRDGAHWPHQVVVQLVITPATALFVGISAVLLARIRDVRTCAWAVVLCYLLVGAHWFQPWYAVWAIALAVLVARPVVVSYTLVLSFFMLLHPIVIQFVASRVKLAPGGFDVVMAVTILLVPQVLAARMAVKRWSIRSFARLQRRNTPAG